SELLLRRYGGYVDGSPMRRLSLLRSRLGCSFGSKGKEMGRKVSVIRSKRLNWLQVTCCQEEIGLRLPWPIAEQYIWTTPRQALSLETRIVKMRTVRR